jgi:quercetin dioxygenase-like cupin family protein
MPSATKFELLDTDKLNPLITRQMISGDDATFARLVLKQGAIVPRHSHRSEQYTMILSGALKFIFDDATETTVHTGEILMIPANIPHSAEAIEDTVDFDFFAPRREDWIRKDDAYLRGGAKKEQ